MKAVIIACPEVKAQGVLAGQEFPQIATVPTSG